MNARSQRRFGRFVSLWKRLLGKSGATSPRQDDYEQKIKAEKARFAVDLDVHALPKIFHYWSHNHLRPLLAEVGISSPDQFFADFLYESWERSGSGAAPVFLSIGAGNCDTEARVAKLLRGRGLQRFTIECLELSTEMLARGREHAKNEGVADHLAFTEADFNRWRAGREYDGIIAHQSLHHVVNLEGLFDEVKRSLAPKAFFITSDVIGRNGHQRWPEALAHVNRLWQELPANYRYNVLLKRHEETYDNWDCSSEGFEGIRAQDVLPLLVERFDFYVYAGFGNVIDLFIDRCFGHHFDDKNEWDQRFIDRVHDIDESGFRDGSLKPTHIMAVMTAGEPPQRRYARGLSPSASVRPTS